MPRIECPLKSAAKKFPDRLFLIDQEREISCAEFDRTVTSLALALQESGLVAGDRVALWLERSESYLALIIALIRLGAVAAPVSRRLPRSVVEQMTNQIGATLLITDTKAAKKTNLREISLDELEQVQDSDDNTLERAVELDVHQPATIIFSSGTTGTPKAIMHSLGNHSCNALGANERISFSENDRWLLSLPLNHVGGLAILFRAWWGSGTIVIGDPALDLAAQVSLLKITHLSLVSTQLQELLAVMNKQEWSGRLKAVLLGGGPIESTLVKKARARQIPLATTYGLSEMASQVTTSQVTTSQLMNSSIGHQGAKHSGQPLKFTELRIDTDGQILVRGMTLFLGYLIGDEIQLPLNDEGWFATGDRGGLDSEGNLIVSGRLDNMFISGGENIYPEEIESVLLAIDSLVEAIVVPIEDEKFGSRPVAFVRFDSSSLLKADQLRQLLTDSLPKFKIPGHFFPWPRGLTSAGLKPSRARLRQMAEETLAQ